MSGSKGVIAEFYRGRHILVTGATGFMGKVLVEKLLRSCPHLERLYLLMRPKKGRDVSQRVEELLSVAIFDWLRDHHPERLQKVEAVSGDLTQPALGLTKADQQRLQTEVSVVFHSAATVKFDEALKLSVAMNLQGTLFLTQLCLNMPKLEALVHVSTAYCNCDLTEVREEVYPPPADPNRILQCVESLDEDILDSITDRITRNRPNTYTFTKALAEHILLKQSSHLPIAIIRPSIVTAAWREPLPGWVDNLNGPTGMFAGAGKGVLRTLVCHRDKVADLIPVDVAINLMLTVAWHTATIRPSGLQVYNCTTGSTNPIWWHNIEKWGHDAIIKYPVSGVLWYPGGSFKSSRLLNRICVLSFHVLPAYILDAVALLMGQKRIMVRVQKKIERASTCLEFFTTHEWKFISDNMLRLQLEMHPADRENFNFDTSNLNWQTYLETYVLGVRRFIMKEDLETLESAKCHLRRMYVLHCFTKLALLVIGWHVLRPAKLKSLGYTILSLILPYLNRL